MTDATPATAYDVLVVGSGPGGAEAALRAAARGRRVALFEAGELGGTCLNRGCIPTKALLRSARALAAAREAALFGVDAGAPRFSLAAAVARKDAVVAGLRQGLAAALRLAQVAVVAARAELLGGGKVAAAGQVWQAPAIVLAPGARPALPPIPGIDAPDVIDSAAALALTEIPRSLCVVGGGAVGLELAAFFRAVGSAVTVLEAAPRLAPGMDGEMARRLQAALAKRGIEFRLSASVRAVDGGRVLCATPAGGEESVPADKVLVAAGRAPNLEGLGRAAAGVAHGPRGIAVDAYGRTSAPGVWACGDAAGGPALAHWASWQAGVAVRDLCGDFAAGAPSPEAPAVPAVIFTEPELAAVGASEEDLRGQGVAYRKASVPLAVSGRFAVECPGAAGTVKVLAGAGDGRLLGVHVLGGPAGEMIGAACAMVAQKMTAAQAAAVVVPHPTVGEALKAALERLAAAG